VRLIVIGASTGGIAALERLASALPQDLDAAVLIVVHVGTFGPGLLPEILSKSGRLPCTHAKTGERIQRGRIYVAPPDYHLLIDSEHRMRLSHGPKENRTRPAIDPLFRSAALAFGPNVIGVVLTGLLDDGAAGLFAIKECGGTAIVQDPADAEAPSMPAHAAAQVAVDHCVPLSELGPLLVRLTKEARQREARAMPEHLKIEAEIAASDEAFMRGVQRIGDPTFLTCPECHGTLLKVREQGPARFRCHTGHGFTSQTLLASIDEACEEAIWNAIRVLQESVMVREHLAEHAKQAGHSDEERKLRQEAHDKLERAQQVRKAIINDKLPHGDDHT
jgi:two-component system, chemotaxis family, protein-glutamate methylesterase/glutaminase